MVMLEAGDKVRVLDLNDTDDQYHERHRELEGKEGVIEKVDTDGTSLVSFNDGQYPKWLRTHRLEPLGGSPPADDGKCSCAGPEKIVHILFQPVRVCTICKREKR